MNEKFFSLPEEKQRRILNAGYRIFSENSYKKSPVGEIAAEAGISKSLLFHYFCNKQELYLYLWEHAHTLTARALAEQYAKTGDDLFALLHRGMRAKLRIMRVHPALAAFTLRAFYERDPAISEHIRQNYDEIKAASIALVLERLDPADFRPGVDLTMMLREMYWTSEGYMWEAMQRGCADIDQLESDLTALFDFWQRIYGAEKGENR